MTTNEVGGVETGIAYGTTIVSTRKSSQDHGNASTAGRHLGAEVEVVRGADPQYGEKSMIIKTVHRGIQVRNPRTSTIEGALAQGNNRIRQTRGTPVVMDMGGTEDGGEDGTLLIT